MDQMISLVTGAIGVAVAIAILVLIRKDQLHVRHGLGWLIVAGLFALLGLSPAIIDQVAGWLGIAYPPVLAMMVAVALLVLKILLMDIERAEGEVRRQRLIQRVALLESELRSVTKELRSSSQESEH